VIYATSLQNLAYEILWSLGKNIIILSSALFTIFRYAPLLFLCTIEYKVFYGEILHALSIYH
jgi:hypothetical protein